MNLQSLLGGIAIGRDTTGNFRPILKGVAVRIEKNRFVGLDNGELLDMTPLTFDNADDIVYRMPIKDPNKGDLIVISDNPLRTLFVQEVLGNGHLTGLDPINSAVIDYAPTANLLKLKFYIKVVSLVDAMVGRTDQDKLLLSLLGKGDGRSGIHDNLLPRAGAGAGQFSHSGARRRLRRNSCASGRKALSCSTRRRAVDDHRPRRCCLQFSGGQVLDQDLTPLLLIRSSGTGAGGAAEVLLLQHLMQGLQRTGGSAGGSTGLARTGPGAPPTGNAGPTAGASGPRGGDSSPA